MMWREIHQADKCVETEGELMSGRTAAMPRETSHNIHAPGEFSVRMMHKLGGLEALSASSEPPVCSVWQSMVTAKGTSKSRRLSSV